MRVGFTKNVAPTIDQDCVAYWKLDEASGMFKDSTGKGYTGAAGSAVGYGADGVCGKCASFDGTSNSKIVVPYQAALNTSAFTVMLWCKVTGGMGAYKCPIASRNSATCTGFCIYANPSNTWDFWCGNGSTWQTSGISTPVVLNKWVHLAFSCNGTSMQMYINGVAPRTPINVNYVPNTTTNFSIGANDAGSSYNFNGLIDEVRLYKRVLTQQEIYRHFMAGRMMV